MRFDTRQTLRCCCEVHSLQKTKYIVKKARASCGGRCMFSLSLPKRNKVAARRTETCVLPTERPRAAADTLSSLPPAHRVLRAAAGSPRSGLLPALLPPRSLSRFLAAWHRLAGPPMETSRTLPIGCQCPSLDQIAGSQSRAAAGGERERQQ